VVPFEWDVRVSSKDHAVTVAIPGDTLTELPIHHSAGRNPGKSYRALASDERARARRAPAEDRSVWFIDIDNALVGELTAATGSQRHALQIAGLSRSTWHYRRNPRPGVTNPIPQKDRAYPSRIDQADRDQIAGLITAGWVEGVSVDHTFADVWDAGVMIASRRSWWRVAADIEDQTVRPVAPTRRRGARPPREAPVLEATGPGQVWSWDITDLRSPWRGVAFKAYSIIDIYSRELVGCARSPGEADIAERVAAGALRPRDP
jgi:putative transposase